jgi:hypothetical protein
MAYEAFDAGIEPGGLRDINEIKILICYLLKNAGAPLSFESINEIIQKDGLANYFEFAQSIKELVDLGNVELTKNNDMDYYTVTKLGVGMANTFERRLPLAVREKAVKAAIRLIARIKIEAENKVTITQTEHGFTAECRVLDGNDEMLSIRLLLPERVQAEAVKRQFHDNPELIYKATLSLMTGDMSFVKEIIDKKI